MPERIDNVKYTKPAFGTTLFLDGPAEFLAFKVADEIKKLQVWNTMFGGFVDFYRRMDYPIRAFPALRIYNENATKQFESWFIEGDLLMDVIYPASIRRNETQQLQDTLSSALLQQFRSTTFFNSVAEGLGEPGTLNELGKRFSVDKSLGFEWNQNIVPLTQITVNFKIDLRKWDEYLTQSDRTKNLPFEKTLGDLERLVTTVAALRDDGETELEEKVDQKPGEMPTTQGD